MRKQSGTANKSLHFHFIFLKKRLREEREKKTNTWLKRELDVFHAARRCGWGDGGEIKGLTERVPQEC